MTLDPGDETHRHGDYIPFLGSGNVNPGVPVKVGSNGEVAALATGDQYLGVYYTDGRPNSDKCTVKVQGTAVAYVDSGVTKGQHLGSPDTAAGEAADAFGTADDQDVIALEDAHEYDNSGSYVAEVLLR